MSYSLCGTTGRNTGPISCDKRRGRPLGLIVGGAVFAPSDYAISATFQAAFKARIQRATGSIDKLFPFPEIQGTTDQTDADKTGTLGYGLKFILLQGKPAYELQMLAGTTQEKAMRAFHGQTIPAYMFDDQSDVWGHTDSAANFIGDSVLVSVKGKGYEDGNNTKYTTVTLSWVNASEFYDQAAFVSTSFGIGDMIGLNDIVLSQISAPTSNVFHIKGVIPTSQLNTTLNPYDYYADALASASLWVVKSGAAGTVPATPLAITSVAKNTAGKGWDVTLDTTAYAALASGSALSFGWTDPASLATAGVLNSEVPQPWLTAKP